MKNWTLEVCCDSLLVCKTESNGRSVAYIASIVDGMLKTHINASHALSGTLDPEETDTGINFDDLGRIMIHPDSLPNSQKPKATAVRRKSIATHIHKIFVGSGSVVVDEEEVNVLSEFFDITLLVIVCEYIPNTLEECLKLTVDAKINDLEKQVNDLFDSACGLIEGRAEILKQIEKLRGDAKK